MPRHVLVVLTVTGALSFGNACSSASKRTPEGGGGSSGGSQGGTIGTAGSGGGTGGSGKGGTGTGGTGTGAAADSGTTGGTSGSADAAGTGGTSGSGGAAGAGGSSGSGGASGAGGSSGSGGAAGTGGATAVGPTPLLHWDLDGNGTNSGTVAGYPLGLNGTVTFVTGKYGQAAQFGAGAYGVVTGSARAVLGSYAQYSISLWVNATSSPSSNAYFDFINRTTAPYGGIQLSYSSATQFTMCVASTTNNYVGGSCSVFSAPAAAAWHHVILRYAGTGTGAGQGAGVDVYEDDVLVKSVSNDATNNPVFNQSISDTLYIGTGGISVDDVRVYDAVFTVANQCTQIIGGTWTGSSCTMP